MDVHQSVSGSGAAGGINKHRQWIIGGLRRRPWGRSPMANHKQLMWVAWVWMQSIRRFLRGSLKDIISRQLRDIEMMYSFWIRKTMGNVERFSYWSLMIWPELRKTPTEHALERFLILPRISWKNPETIPKNIREWKEEENEKKLVDGHFGMYREIIRWVVILLFSFFRSSKILTDFVVQDSLIL